MQHARFQGRQRGDMTAMHPKRIKVRQCAEQGLQSCGIWSYQRNGHVPATCKQSDRELGKRAVITSGVYM